MYVSADVPDGIFLTFLSSPNFSNETADAFEHTSGDCLQYVQLQTGNHYAMTNWNPTTAPHQVQL